MLRIRDIQKAFGREQVLRGVDLDLSKGEVLAILGRSGCGKTTLLKILAGLLAPDNGAIDGNGESLLDIPARERGILYLYQEPMLFPHLNVFQNIAFGLTLRKLGNAEISTRVTALMTELGLEGMDKKMPEELSGGQKQRVSFGRALILSPRIVLLDEPFGHLDAGTRAEMQQLFIRVCKEHGTTGIFVTHDIREALTVGHRFAVMDKGRLYLFNNKQEFLSDPRSGATGERDFWREQFENGDPDQG